MAWIASADHKEARFSPNGLGVDRHEAPLLEISDGSTMTRGTLLLETRMSPMGSPRFYLAMIAYFLGAGPCQFRLFREVGLHL